MSKTLTSEWLFKAKVVYLVLSKDTERAIELIGRHQKIAKPKLKVGMRKRHSMKLVCYVAKKQTIHVSCREISYNLHVVLHKFYHHLRNVTAHKKA